MKSFRDALICDSLSEYFYAEYGWEKVVDKEAWESYQSMSNPVVIAVR